MRRGGILLLGMYGCTPKMQDYSSYVNPFIGTGGHGHTYPGAIVPNGMIQPGPDTRIYQLDACSGYYYADSTVGRQDYHAMGKESQQMAYASAFSHENETAQPG